jgi:hypothetical protein
VAGSVIQGGTLDVEATGLPPSAAGGRGNRVGPCKDTASLVRSVCGSWAFRWQAQYRALVRLVNTRSQEVSS